MKNRSIRSLRGTLSALSLTLFGTAILGLSACSPVIIVGNVGGGGTGGAGGNPNLPKATKVDLLLAVDNSSSMADKQNFLATAVPDLIDRLVNPLCVDGSGIASTQQPTNPVDGCPSGFTREFAPIEDINIGIVDSSLGGLGSDACSDSDPARNNNDMGHLITRAPHGTITYQGEGFLAWDPSNKRGGITNVAELRAGISDLILGTGQIGCGFEQTLEAVTRFLVDPSPYAQLVKGQGGIPEVTPSGIDQTLLSQRASFLRPDSLLAVVLLSDENDCSVNVLGPQNYSPLNNAPFFAASSICATNPNDPCCYSCGLGAPSGCTPDPACSVNGGKLAATDDNINLKCWNQKKRYGFDGLFPVKRYVNAFSQTEIDPQKADLSVSDGGSPFANPLFAGRDPGLVFFMSIVGVPYQVIATDPTDLGRGLQSSTDLSNSGFFDHYVGDPDHHVEPTEPIMIETFEKRGVPVGSPNGGDRTISPSDDLQYACIFDLPTANPIGPDCQAALPDNPLCTAGGEPEVKAKGYPGLRELAVVHGLGNQGIVGSICPQSSTSPTSDKDGYLPEMAALVDRMKGRLSP